MRESAEQMPRLTQTARNRQIKFTMVHGVVPKSRAAC